MKEGLEAARRDALLSPENGAAWDRLGQTLIKGAQIKGSIDYFRRASMIPDPERMARRLRLAMALEMGGALESAVEQYLAALPDGERRPSLPLFRAIGCLQRSNEMGRIVALAAGQSPGDWREFPQAISAIGLAHAAKGDALSAIAWMFAYAPYESNQKNHRKLVGALMARGLKSLPADQLGYFLVANGRFAFSDDRLIARLIRAALHGRADRELLSVLQSADCIAASDGRSLLFAIRIAARLKRQGDLLRSAMRRLVLVPDCAGAMATLLGEAARRQTRRAHRHKALWSKAIIAVPTADATQVNDAVIAVKGIAERPVQMSYLRSAAVRFPAVPQIQYNIGFYLNEGSFAEEAAPLLRRALIVSPEYDKAWSAYSVSCSIMLMAADGVRAAKRAISCNPRLASAWINMGMGYRGLGDTKRSLDAGLQAVRLDPKDCLARMGVAFNQLSIGAIEQGFENYRARWGQPHFPSDKRPFHQPEWRKHPVPPGRKVLIYMEQGMGDEIMFSWFLRCLEQDAAGRIVVECDARLVPLLARSFPAIEFVGRQVPIPRRLFGADIAFKLPVGHLPSYYTYELRRLIRERWEIAGQPFASGYGYLVPDPERVAHWRDELASYRNSDRLVVGVCWRSANRTRTRDQQYVSTEEIIAALPDGCVAVNLQYSYDPAEVDEMAGFGRQRGIDVVTLPGIDLKDDLDDLTSLIRALDVVVTPLISTAFMGAAVGVPTFVFRSAADGTIWQQLGTPHIPWLPAMRLFFRHPAESWADAVRRINERLTLSAEALRRGGLDE